MCLTFLHPALPASLFPLITSFQQSLCPYGTTSPLGTTSLKPSLSCLLENFASAVMPCASCTVDFHLLKRSFPSAYKCVMSLILNNLLFIQILLRCYSCFSLQNFFKTVAWICCFHVLILSITHCSQASIPPASMQLFSSGLLGSSVLPNSLVNGI